MKGLSIDRTFDIDYNLDYLIIVPKKDLRLFDAFTYTFGNTLLFENSVSDVEYLNSFIKNNTIGRLIFVDYYLEYDEVINSLIDEHKIDFIFTGYLGELSDAMLLEEYNIICDKYDSRMIDGIAFLDINLYRAVRGKRRNTWHIMLDIAKEDGEKVERQRVRTVGLLNIDASNYDSFYNQLCGVSLLPNYKVKLHDPSVVTKDFLSEYDIEFETVENYQKLFKGNCCNLYINFTATNPLVFIKSMDCETPCILGNNSFISSDYPVLAKALVLKSDDDANEIADKIKLLSEKRDDVMEEYVRFRADYSKKTKELLNKFLGIEKKCNIDDNDEKLLSVVVPVYNTEQYLAKCLDSVIEARIDGMEILIIDDGSTDESDRIAKDYVDRFPDLIRYYRQKNQGLGSVRNVGLAQAKGKYIASVDSDDTIERGFFEEALLYMQNDIDVIVCDWMSVGDEKSFETAAIDWVFEKRKKMEGLLYTTIMPSTCNKIMKKRLFVENEIKYLEQKYEDLSANPLALIRAKTIKYIHRPFYNYYLRSNSLMRSKIDPRQMVDALMYLDNRMPRRSDIIDIEEFKYYTYAWRIEEYVFNPLYEMKGKDLSRAVEYIYKNLFSLIDGVNESKYYKQMLSGLKNKELREYITRRNAAFKKKELRQFIVDARSPQKLTAAIIYYGD